MFIFFLSQQSVMEVALKVLLLDYTPNLEQLIASAAKLCYSDASIPNLLQKMTPERAKKLIDDLMDLRHESPLEHAKYTFGIEGFSRATTHQLVRHRLASFSQQSQRYVSEKRDEGTFGYVCPPTVKKLGKEKDFSEVMQYLQNKYSEYVAAGIPPEDARYVLPNAAESKMMFTANVRELFHIFNLRLCNRAQWEFRNLAEEMYNLVYPTAPTIWAYAGPNCVSKGYCTEGKFSCRKAKEMQEKYAKIKKELENAKTKQG
ncbi:MAG: FAD-dependent thymidylate synthase [Candidatus Nanoarchaeia archaeon]